MARPRKDDTVNAQIVVIIHNKLVKDGFFEVVRRKGRLVAARPPGKQTGPWFELPPDTIKLRISDHRGRPKAGEISLVHAIALACGKTERTVNRLIGRLLKPKRRNATNGPCPLCGLSPGDHPNSSLSVSSALVAPSAPGITRDLAAVGLTVAPTAAKPPPPSPSQAHLADLCDTLDAALGMGFLPAEAKPLAERLLAAVRAKV